MPHPRTWLAVLSVGLATGATAVPDAAHAADLSLSVDLTAATHRISPDGRALTPCSGRPQTLAYLPC
jgi:hypothetical protein